MYNLPQPLADISINGQSQIRIRRKIWLMQFEEMLLYSVVCLCFAIRLFVYWHHDYIAWALRWPWCLHRVPSVADRKGTAMRSMRLQMLRAPLNMDIHLTHCGRDEIVAISQTTLSNAFSWMRMLKFRLLCHCNLFLRVQLTIFQHRLGQWLGAVLTTTHYLKQCQFTDAYMRHSTSMRWIIVIFAIEGVLY